MNAHRAITCHYFKYILQYVHTYVIFFDYELIAYKLIFILYFKIVFCLARDDVSRDCCVCFFLPKL